MSTKLDTLHLVSHCPLDDKIKDMLRSHRNYLLDSGSPQMIISLKGQRCILHSYCPGRYTYRLEFDGFQVFFTEKNSKRSWCSKILIGSVTCYFKTDLIQGIVDYVTNFLLVTDKPTRVWQFSRVDGCRDVPFDMNKYHGLNESFFMYRGRPFSDFHYRSSDFLGFVFGKTSLVCRCYCKTSSLSSDESLKSSLYTDYYSNSFGESSKVSRLEFQARRPFMTSVGYTYYDDVSSLLDVVDSLFKYIFTELLVSSSSPIDKSSNNQKFTDYIFKGILGEFFSSSDSYDGTPSRFYFDPEPLLSRQLSRHVNNSVRLAAMYLLYSGKDPSDESLYNYNDINNFLLSKYSRRGTDDVIHSIHLAMISKSDGLAASRLHAGAADQAPHLSDNMWGSFVFKKEVKLKFDSLKFSLWG